MVRRLALSAPGVAFRLELDGRVVFEAPAQDRIERVAALLGAEAAAVMLPVHEERDAQAVLRIGGYICSPAVTRATPVAQTLIVNNRPVADPVLRTAVKVAYRDVIAAGRHAIVALYLDVPPDELDVNVHPAKTELRFRDANAVRSLVIGSVRRALGVGTGQVVPMPSGFGLVRWVRPGRAGSHVGPPPRPSYPPPLSVEPGRFPARQPRRGAAAVPRRTGRAADRAPDRPASRRTIRWARRWRRCWTPTSSPSPRMGRWCWSISTPRMNA